MKLIIVEAPTKAKTISKFLGPKFKVMSSYGHIRDLPEKKMGIDIEKNFAPQYIVNPKSEEKAELLKKAAKTAEAVILASDEDREGEAIAWHLSEILKLNSFSRMSFALALTPSLSLVRRNSRTGP